MSTETMQRLVKMPKPTWRDVLQVVQRAKAPEGTIAFLALLRPNYWAPESVGDESGFHQT
jgi:hypothetical protein